MKLSYLLTAKTTAYIIPIRGNGDIAFFNTTLDDYKVIQLDETSDYIAKNDL